MKFLYNAPAILHKGALIVGDTHFGMEFKLRDRGIHDAHFSMRLMEKLKELIKKHKAKKLIFLGDVKENITSLDNNTKQVLSELSEMVEITIVKGNHDGNIERFQCPVSSVRFPVASYQNAGHKTQDTKRETPNSTLNTEHGTRNTFSVSGAGGIVYEGLGLLHGHSWPDETLMQCRYLVMGHQHPMIRITDTIGKKHTEPVWIIAPLDQEKTSAYYEKFNKKIELILMPAFNPLVGSVINYTKKEQLGPVLNNKLFKLERALVFRLDGTGLGKLLELG